MKIDITYTVPVVVTVDTASKTVDRVFLDMERITLMGPTYLSGTSTRSNRQTGSRALKIAESTEWPAWER